MDYEKRKQLSKNYQSLGINISFSDYLKTLGIHKGRPSKKEKRKKG